MEGRVDKKADTDFNPPYITNGVNGNVMNATSATLGFCNSNTALDTWYGPELPVAGDYAKWMIEPIDDTNYFGVTCLTSPDVKDAEGNWYTTAYFDFPFTVNNGDAYYISKTTSRQGLITSTRQLLPRLTAQFLLRHLYSSKLKAFRCSV
jgi:hypothetical protein